MKDLAIVILCLAWPVYAQNFSYDVPNPRPQFTFSDELGAKLLSRMKQGKPVSLMTVGSASDQRLGDDFQKFLEDQGYAVRRTSIGMLAPPPDHPFSFVDNPNEYLIIVSPSAK